MQHNREEIMNNIQAYKVAPTFKKECRGRMIQYHNFKTEKGKLSGLQKGKGTMPGAQGGVTNAE